MVEPAEHTVSVGATVRIRSVRPPGMQAPPPPGVKLGGEAEVVVAIVPPDQVGLYKLSPRMPLGRALLGHQAGDVVPVSVEAGTVEFEVLAVEAAGV
jgi:hypothetical protein